MTSTTREVVAGVAQGVRAGDKAVYIPVNGFPDREEYPMPNYRVKLTIEGGKDDGKTKSFYVNAPTVSDAIDEAMRQAQQQDPEVTGGFVDEVS